jgi:hypothetical protein
MIGCPNRYSALENYDEELLMMMMMNKIKE